MVKVSNKKTSSENNTGNSKLYRVENNKIIGGVAAGIGEYFNIDPTIIRLLFVILTVFSGSGIIIYLLLWIIIPIKNSQKTSEDNIKENVEDIKNTAEKYAHDLQINSNSDNNRSWWGIAIILIGVIFLLNNFGLNQFVDFNKFWPLLLVAFGLIIFLRK